ncbi:MAG: type 4a pilus biogenesis protein PilO [bacterium]
MRWIDDLTNAVKVRTILIALIIFITTNLGIIYFVLRPCEKSAQTLERNLNNMRENYTQLKSQNLNSILDILNEEVKNLVQKEKRVFSSTLSNEEIPLFITKLEREANNSGLNVYSSVVNNEIKKSGLFTTISVDLNFAGSFQEVLNFLRVLASWDEVLLINAINIKKKIFMTLNYQVRLKLLY